MSPDSQACFICNHQRARVTDFGASPGFLAECPHCGKYTVEHLIATDLQDAHSTAAPALLPYLSAYVRQHNSPVTPVTIPHDWRQHARAHAQTPVGSKLRRLLEHLGQLSPSIGETFQLIPLDVAPWVDARDSSEVVFLLENLRALGRITLPALTSSAATCRVEVAGWEALAPIAGGGVPGTCFIAMSFSTELNDAYDHGIRPAVEDCGFSAIRVDRVEHNDDITDQILAGIRSAQFLVADFTRHSPGVYFEAGFAAGLGREVVSTCRADDFEHLHFDTRQRNHVKWSTPLELRAKLTDRIRATVALPARLR